MLSQYGPDSSLWLGSFSPGTLPRLVAHYAGTLIQSHYLSSKIDSHCKLPFSCTLRSAKQQAAGAYSLGVHSHLQQTQAHRPGGQEQAGRLAWCHPCHIRPPPPQSHPACRPSQPWGQHRARGGSPAHPPYRCRGTPQLQEDLPLPLLLNVSNANGAPPTGIQDLQEAIERCNTQAAYKAFKRMRRQDPDAPLPGVTTCERLLEVMCEGRDFVQCWSVYQAVKSVALGRRCLRSLMDRAIKAQDMKGALEVFRDMQARNMRISKVAWCYMISSLNRVLKRKGWPYAEAAYQIWEELQKQDFGPQDSKDAQYYIAGMMACIGVRRVDEAEQLLVAMQDAGFSPDVRAHNILLTGLARGQQVEAMERAFARIRQAGLAPSVTSYNIMVDAYTRAGMHAKARATLVEAKGDGVKADVCTYTSLINGAVRANRLDEARSVLKDMDRAKVQPNVVTMITLVDGYVRADMMEEAEGVLKSMAQRRIKPSVILYNTLLRGYSKKGDLKAVRDVLQRMGEEGVHPREDTFNTLMEGALTADNPEMVPNLFKQLLGLRLRPDSLSYTALITALSRLSRYEAAIREAGKLEAVGGLDLISLNALTAVLASADRLGDAEDTLQKASALAASKGFPPPVEAYGALLQAYTRKNNASAALDLLAEFRQQGGEIDEWLVSMTVTACVRAGEFRKALRFVRAMEQEGKDIDKTRLKRTLEAVLRMREQSYKRNFKELPRNENLERFKFWLGLPNHYYDL